MRLGMPSFSRWAIFVPLDGQENICTIPSHIATRGAIFKGHSHIGPHGSYMRRQGTHRAPTGSYMYMRMKLRSSKVGCAQQWFVLAQTFSSYSFHVVCLILLHFFTVNHSKCKLTHINKKIKMMYHPLKFIQKIPSSLIIKHISSKLHSSLLGQVFL